MLTPAEYRLINGHELEAVPACLYRAKSNAQARLLAQNDWLIRNKVTGAYLGTYHQNNLKSFNRGSNLRLLEDGFEDLLLAQSMQGLMRPAHDSSLILNSLGIDGLLYSEAHNLKIITEPYILEYAGKDRYQRPLWLESQTKNAWLRMRCDAKTEDIFLEAISGYRSCQYQKGIFDRKLARGQTIEQILKVNTAPGFSEHHSGQAIDISTKGEPAAEESFENTDTFKWLNKNASRYGFVLSYPRNNTHHINYEPWHWCWQANS
jgi:D-alanyl-D-alanine carboxypeptidase